jgi:hypothetical protein
MFTAGQLRAVVHQSNQELRPALVAALLRAKRARWAERLAASEWIKEKVDWLLDRPRRLFDSSQQRSHHRIDWNRLDEERRKRGQGQEA